MSDFLLKNGDKVVFIGDSITDCGRRDTAAPFGNGYVKMAIDLIMARYPGRKATFYTFAATKLRHSWRRGRVAAQY